MARNTKRLPSDNFEVPALAAANPQFAKLSSTYSELNRRNANVRAEIAALAQALHGTRTNPSSSNEGAIEEHQKLVEDLGELAADLLESGVIVPPRRPELTEQDRLRALTRDKDVCETAIALVRPKLETERLAASRKIVADFKPYYASLVREMVDAVIAMGAATLKLNNFYRECTEKNVSLSTLNQVGHPPLFGRGGTGTNFLKGAIAAGYVAKADIPQELLDENV